MSLDLLKQKIAKCTRCKELAANRTQTVFGVGNPEARILFLGEAPGADEDKQGIPFVGMAGKMLDNILAAMKLDRTLDVYICNVLKCRPPGNRNPSSEEAFNCDLHLQEQIRLIAPRFIVCLGAVASQHLLITTDKITDLRGRWHKYRGIPVICTYHPSYLVRAGNKEYGKKVKAMVWGDMKILLAALQAKEKAK